MELADRKAAFIAANGDSVTIIRSGGNIQTTARIMAMKRRTGFFSINYLREALFVPSCGIQRGDLVQNNATGEQYFVEGFQPKTRGGVISSYDVELYTVNYPSVQIQRITKTYDTSGNVTGSSWTTVATVPANVEHTNGNTPYKDGLLLVSTVFKITMQTVTSVQLLDRFIIDGKHYKADDINLSIIPGLQVIQVSIDMR